ncbi:MAG TPA: hypothetical protein DCQ98_01495 [Planctomycetaceae bacterium]|nr:hypothetical protein [Planctomycetaceae bacterium]HRE99621.1 DUF2149 domain-containing protein [Pirellulaceae bacterium]
MRGRRSRPWRSESDDDPTSGLVNLFDLWMVVIVALLVLLVRLPIDAPSRVASEPAADADPTPVDLLPLERFRESDRQLTGRGVKLGIAYRLENGEVVYAAEAPAE